ncbi:MAG: hypothetical protein DF168_00598 [Candidatus Moanabacter tarae]|uniref:Uncharacterized protein n=1 Tax=Candidatus Moanibacter tarae TaxID=2200854 RepID=A0A2Z4ABM6_9BACT|nr:MAG: hypothetical protein DF168_00598 [Candidatus Moanabacter tarae]|tara:strand:+ start:3329 stop:4891 length:1563 start_codon:yes stop_codon:yes gene_type:complete
MASQDPTGDSNLKLSSMKVEDRGAKDGEAEDKVDLALLRELEMGPEWIVPGYKAERSKESRGAGEKIRPKSPRIDWRHERGDRRKKPAIGKELGRRDSRSSRGSGIEKRNSLVEEFEVSFSPDEKAFQALAKAIRANCRTYELFEIARLILEKPERFVVMIRSSRKKESEKRKLYISVPDGLPFETEEDVTDYVLKNFIEEFFAIESIKVDPPTGKFPLVNQCSLTDEIIGPPNYHRYQEFERTHIAERLSHLSLAEARSRIESVKDPEKIECWLQKMTQQTLYKLRVSDDEGTTPPVFESLESAGRYLLVHQRQRVFKSSFAAKLGGREIDKLRAGSNLRLYIMQALEDQKRFPLATASFLRGRLKRMKFDVYKKGSKGINYVCAVRRKIGLSDNAFAEPVQELIDFIQKNPDIRAFDLPKELSKSPRTSDKVDESALDYKGRTVDQITHDLRWLVAEGYVIEYSNGRLQVATKGPPRANDSLLTKKGAEDLPLTQQKLKNQISDEKAESLPEAGKIGK